MKSFKVFLVVLLLLVNLVVARPVLADKMSEKSPDYPQVIQELNHLLQVKDNPAQSEYTTEELTQKISDLSLQKQVLETSEDWGICQNETNQILAIYARKPKKVSLASLYYLASGQTTDEDWDCDAIYVPSDGKVVGFNLIEGEPTVIKIIDGTELVATTNPQTSEIVFDVPLALVDVFEADKAGWLVPNLTQADINLQTPNAPTD